MLVKKETSTYSNITVSCMIALLEMIIEYVIYKARIYSMVLEFFPLC